MNLARLNHILVPKTHDRRERWRTGRVGHATRPVRWLNDALSREGRALALLSLFVGVAGLETDSTQVYVVWSALAGLLIASLLVRRTMRMTSVVMEVQVPPRVAQGEPATFSLTLRNEGEQTHRNVRIRGPFLPWDGTWIASVPGVANLPPGGVARCDLQARFEERGGHYLDPFSAAPLMPMGLAVAAGVRTAGCRFLVVPRIAPVASLELPTGSRYQPGGVAQASQTGEAMELFGVRPYRPGDSVRDLHVRTWARVGVPHVKEYQQEYFTRIGIILDTDRTVSEERRLEAAVSLAAGVVSHLSRGEALIDVLVVGAEVHSLTVGRSLGFLDQALDLLATAREGEEMNVEGVMARLDPYLEPLACVVLITQAAGPRRAELVSRIERYGVQCRVLHVVDDDSISYGPLGLPVTPEQINGDTPMQL